MKTFVLFAFLAFVSVFANAQQSSIDAMTTEPVAFQPTVYSMNYADFSTSYASINTSESIMVVNQSYSNDAKYKNAKLLRNAGIVTTCVGLVGAAAFGIAGEADSDKTLGFSALAGLTGAVIGGGVAVVGGILWIAGQSKMNKIKAASSGVGLAFQF